jgi:integrase
MLREHINNVARKKSNNTANVDLMHIIAAFNWGIEMDILPAPCPWNIQKLRIKESEVHVPSFEDLQQVLFAAKTFQDKIMIQIYFETAARRAEILRLKWQDVDLERNTVRLWTGKRRGGMQSDVIRITEQLSRSLTEHKLKTGLLEYVFINPKSNKPYTDRGAWLDGLIKKAGVNRFTTHQIRHLVASTLIDEKESLGTVQSVLRHKCATTTARYIHRLRGVELPTAIAEMVPRLNPDQALRNNAAENM